MSQHDYILENATGALFRQDLNNALRAIAENNMAATAPTTTYAGMWWLDTSTSPATLRLRNNANTAWVNCGNLNELGFITGLTSNVQAQLNAKANLASPALTGTPTAPTAAAGTNTTQIATTAFVASTAIGVEQTWQNVKASRTGNVTYTNTTGKPIAVYILVGSGVMLGSVTLTVNSVVLNIWDADNNHGFIFAIIPNNAAYILSTTNIITWAELR